MSVHASMKMRQCVFIVSSYKEFLETDTQPPTSAEFLMFLFQKVEGGAQG